MPKLTIDGREVEVPAGLTVLQACESSGVEIPKFCYHERLSIAGNCRMCLVEMEKAPKPIASCAMPVAEGMVIRTDTPTIRKARKGVMEFLLINHPLDCPICDQGGECDLQDQAMGYGFDRTRYTENKRAVKDKELGPIVKTIMTRCIHCTRCVRFATEVAGVEELGAVFRGENMEIGTYVERALTSELSGNLVDLCPVGALTSKPYAFTARPWELKKTESIDVMDAVGSNIRIDARGSEVMRVLPRLHEDVNEEWISDKTRHACDGLKRQRLDRPYLRGADGKLKPAAWPQVLQVVAQALQGAKPERIAALAGDLVEVESLFALKSLLGGLGVTNLECRQDGAAIDPEQRAGYLFNPGIAGIDQADLILLIGADLRREAAIVNARVRKRFLSGQLKVAAVGAPVATSYPIEILGGGPDTLVAIADGSHPFAARLQAAKAPIVILGQAALTRPDGAAVAALVHRLCERTRVVRPDWTGYAMLHTAAARVGALDLGFVPGPGGLDRSGILAAAADGRLDVLWLHGADEIDTTRLGKTFVVYQGHHGDAGAHRADAILPGAAYTEKDGLYVNTEGRKQVARAAVFPPGDAREDWKILRALSDRMGRPLPFDDLSALRAALYQDYPHFAGIDRQVAAEWGPFGKAGPVDATPFAAAIANFYMTDPISRASETMAACTAAAAGHNQATGTHG